MSRLIRSKDVISEDIIPGRIVVKNINNIVSMLPRRRKSKVTKNYKQFYRKAWEEVPEFKGWLSEIPGERTLAYCKICDRTLHAHRLSLTKHTVSLKHWRLSQRKGTRDSPSQIKSEDYHRSEENIEYSEMVGGYERSEMDGEGSSERDEEEIVIVGEEMEGMEEGEIEEGSGDIAGEEGSEVTVVEVSLFDNEEEEGGGDGSTSGGIEDNGNKEQSGQQSNPQVPNSKPSNNPTSSNPSPHRQSSHHKSSTNQLSPSGSGKTMAEKAAITTHILDLTKGSPAGAMPVSLYRLIDGRWTLINEGESNPDGRWNCLASGNGKPGRYKLHFDTDRYFEALKTPSIYPFVEVVFDVFSPDDKFHIPLLLSPYGYSTYRGS